MSLKITETQIKDILSFLEKNTSLRKGCKFTPWTWYDIMGGYENGIDYDKGCSKLVMYIPEYEDFVIKIPFNGYTEVYFGDEEEGIEYEFFEFSGASTPNGWDYCDVEVDRYDQAITYEVNDLFAETRYIGDVNGYPIYAQERACDWEYLVLNKDIISEESKSIVTTRTDSLSNTYNGAMEFSSLWMSLIVERYGAEKLDNFIAFINDFNCKDFHTSNYGVLSTEDEEDHPMPIVFDYSNFNDGWGESYKVWF